MNKTNEQTPIYECVGCGRVTKKPDDDLALLQRAGHASCCPERDMRLVRLLPAASDVDALAQEIRRVDGDHSLGAGALAEALMPFLSRLLPAPSEATGKPALQVGGGEAAPVIRNPLITASEAKPPEGLGTTTPWTTHHCRSYPKQAAATINKLLQDRAAASEAGAVPDEMRHVCNLWIDPKTRKYVVDSCDHPPTECIPAYIGAPPAPVEAGAATLPAWWASFIQNVCEIPDRNSPEGEPEAMIATRNELEACALRAIEDAAPSDTPAQQEKQAAQPWAWTTADGWEPISDAVKRARLDVHGKHYTVPLFKAAQPATVAQNKECPRCGFDERGNCDYCEKAEALGAWVPRAKRAPAAQGDMGNPISESNQQVAQGDERAAFDRAYYRWDPVPLSDDMQGWANEKITAYDGWVNGIAWARAALARQPSANVEDRAVAWMTPGGDVSRSYLWCKERCIPGAEPSPLYYRTTVLSVDRQPSAGDAELLDHLESLRQEAISRGFQWDTWKFDAKGSDLTIRQQIDAARAQRAGKGDA